MWRPIEVFLYDWWPILGEVRLLERLSRMPVRIQYHETMADEAWRSDWPAVPTYGLTASHPRAGASGPSERTGPAGRPVLDEPRHSTERLER